MHNYFFTLTSASGSERRYREGQFPDLEHAFWLAELMAGELSIDQAGPWPGGTIEVRDCQGSLVLSVPVGQGNALGTTEAAFAGIRSRQPEFSHGS